MACSFGYRFHPTEEELVSYYLRNKITGKPLPWEGIMIERNIYGENATPWELFGDDDPGLPWHIVMDGLGKVIHSERVLYVFTRLTRVGKVGTKQKIRVAGCGSWHGNNTAEGVPDGQGNQIGCKKTFKFRHNNNKAAASEWIMREYSLAGCEDYVLCKIKRIESRGKKLESRKRIITDGPVESTGDVGHQRLGKKIRSGITSGSTATTSDTGISCFKNERMNTVEHQEIHWARTGEEAGKDHADQTLSGIHFVNQWMNPVLDDQEIQCPTVNEEANSALTGEDVAYASFLNEYLDN